MAVQFLKTTKGDPLAMKPLLDSFTDSTEEEIRRVAVPSLVVCGEDDEDNGSAEALAALLPNVQYVRSEEHTSELQSLMSISYAVFCLQKKTTTTIQSPLTSKIHTIPYNPTND